MIRKYVAIMAAVLFLAVFAWGILPSVGLAADGSASGGYLSSYDNADPRPSQVSWWSTLAYLVSLFAVFAFVVVLAYFASRFLSGRFAQMSTGNGGRILEHLPLGPNRSVCVVELAGRILMLGVTEHSVTLLGEITDDAEIEQLQRRMLARPPMEGAFSQQLSSIEQFARRLPSLFKDDYHK